VTLKVCQIRFVKHFFSCILIIFSTHNKKKATIKALLEFRFYCTQMLPFVR